MARNYLLGMAVVFLFSACKQEPLPAPVAGWTLPAHFPAARYDFSQNPTTEAGFALGRKLFYDPILSVDSSISCGSCHQQSLAFADGVAFSRGFQQRLGARNSPALQNLAWYTSFNYDGGINHLDLQPIAPLTDPREHADDLLNIFEKLRQHPDYPAMFEAAFGSRNIQDRSLLLAMSQFTSRLISANSKYDQVQLQQAHYNEQERLGYGLFKTHCASCHQEPLFTNFSFKRNGHGSSTQDAGRALVTGDAADESRFRVPSLRNIALTAPYMHDGSLETLEAVLAHYEQACATAEAPLGTGIPLSTAEKLNLIAFLHTLTDWSFVTDPRFAAPQ
jgi:cytochrome c peroxidase